MLHELTLCGLAAKLDAREVSAREAMQACLDRIDAVDGRVSAFMSVDRDDALGQADAADAALAKGATHAGQPLLGVPVSMKDLFCIRGQPANCSSKILGDFRSPYDGTVVRKLRDAGAVLFGRVNMDEFAMGSSTENSAFGRTHNPWDLERVPGGSSGGSAAAVVAQECFGSIGTDTGGSIRQPAAFTGIVGMKPTYGRCSRWGIVAFASSLDQAGPMTRSVRDAAIMLGAMAGFDRKDSTSAQVAVPDFEAALTGDMRGLKIGIPKEYRVDGMPAEIEALWRKGVDWLEAAGAEIVEIGLPHTKYALPAYYIVAPAEASSNLARYDGVRYGLREEGAELIDMYESTRAAGFGPEVQRRVLIGTYVLSAGYYDAYYIKAQQVRELIARDFRTAFAEVDAILTPTTPYEAFAIGERADDPIAMYLNDVLTVPANLAGLPGISVPAALSENGLPLGLQVLAKAFDDETVFRVAGVLEEAADFQAQPERWWEAD